MLSQYSNPYNGKDFFGFIFEFLKRVVDVFTGKLAVGNLVSDEIQIIVLMGIAASAALVGSFLILRKMTMLANSLSHTILLGIVAVYILTRDGMFNNVEPLSINAFLAASLVMGLVTAFLTEFLTKTARLQEDASTGIVFTSLFALGIILLTLFTKNAHIGTEVVMGNVDALHIDDCKLVLLILGINIFIFLLFFKEYAITTFDPGLSKALGISTVFYNYLLMTQVSATCVGAFRAVGVLMVLAFITGPVLMARMLTDSLKRMILYAVGIGCLCSFIGVAVSRHLLSMYGLTLSTAGIVVCTIVVFFITTLLFNSRNGLFINYYRRRNVIKV